MPLLRKEKKILLSGDSPTHGSLEKAVETIHKAITGFTAKITYARVYHILESRLVVSFINVCIVFSILCVIFETQYREEETFWLTAEALFTIIFTLEFGLRLWSCVAEDGFVKSQGGDVITKDIRNAMKLRRDSKSSLSDKGSERRDSSSSTESKTSTILHSLQTTTFTLDSYGTRRAFIVQPLNVLDLFSILPFYIAFFVTTETVTAFRILRIFRLIRILQSCIPGGLYLMSSTCRRSFTGISIYAFFVLVGMVLFAALIYYAEKSACPEDIHTWSQQDREEYDEACENTKSGWTRDLYYQKGARLCCDLKTGASMHFPSIAQASWWALVTMTTTGYGDMVPTTTLGRCVGFVTMLSGILVISMPAAIIGSKFQEAVEEYELLHYESFVEKSESAENSVNVSTNASANGSIGNGSVKGSVHDDIDGPRAAAAISSTTTTSAGPLIINRSSKCDKEVGAVCDKNDGPGSQAGKAGIAWSKERRESHSPHSSANGASNSGEEEGSARANGETQQRVHPRLRDILDKEARESKRHARFARYLIKKAHEPPKPDEKTLAEIIRKFHEDLWRIKTSTLTKADYGYANQHNLRKMLKCRYFQGYFCNTADDLRPFCDATTDSSDYCSHASDSDENEEEDDMFVDSDENGEDHDGDEPYDTKPKKVCIIDDIKNKISENRDSEKKNLGDDAPASGRISEGTDVPCARLTEESIAAAPMTSGVGATAGVDTTAEIGAIVGTRLSPATVCIESETAKESLSASPTEPFPAEVMPSPTGPPESESSNVLADLLTEGHVAHSARNLINSARSVLENVFSSPPASSGGISAAPLSSQGEKIDPSFAGDDRHIFRASPSAASLVQQNMTQHLSHINCDLEESMNLATGLGKSMKSTGSGMPVSTINIPVVLQDLDTLGNTTLYDRTAPDTTCPPGIPPTQPSAPPTQSSIAPAKAPLEPAHDVATIIPVQTVVAPVSHLVTSETKTESRRSSVTLNNNLSQSRPASSQQSARNEDSRESADPLKNASSMGPSNRPLRKRISQERSPLNNTIPHLITQSSLSTVSNLMPPGASQDLGSNSMPSNTLQQSQEAAGVGSQKHAISARGAMIPTKSQTSNLVATASQSSSSSSGFSQPVSASASQVSWGNSNSIPNFSAIDDTMQSDIMRAFNYAKNYTGNDAMGNTLQSSVVSTLPIGMSTLQSSGRANLQASGNSGRCGGNSGKQAANLHDLREEETSSVPDTIDIHKDKNDSSVPNTSTSLVNKRVFEGNHNASPPRSSSDDLGSSDGSSWPSDDNNTNGAVEFANPFLQDTEPFSEGGIGNHTEQDAEHSPSSTNLDREDDPGSNMNLGDSTKLFEGSHERQMVVRKARNEAPPTPDPATQAKWNYGPTNTSDSLGDLGLLIAKDKEKARKNMTNYDKVARKNQLADAIGRMDSILHDFDADFGDFADPRYLHVAGSVYDFMLGDPLDETKSEANLYAHISGRAGQPKTEVKVLYDSPHASATGREGSGLDRADSKNHKSRKSDGLAKGRSSGSDPRGGRNANADGSSTRGDPNLLKTRDENPHIPPCLVPLYEEGRKLRTNFETRREQVIGLLDQVKELEQGLLELRNQQVKQQGWLSDQLEKFYLQQIKSDDVRVSQ